MKFNYSEFLNIFGCKAVLEDEHIVHYIFGKKIFATKSKTRAFQKKFAPRNNDFDTRALDSAIEKYADKNFHEKSSNEINPKNIAILATDFSDVGGHTECVRRMVSNLSDTYNIATFLTNIKKTYELAPNKIELIKQHSTIDGMDYYDVNFEQNIEDLVEKIEKFAPKVLFVFINPDDAIGTTIMALMKKYTKTKVVFFCHASHYAALGYHLSDLILVAMKSTHCIDKQYRKCDKHYVLNMFSDKAEDVKYYSEDEIKNKRQELGIKDDEYLTMSGAGSYKFFDGDTSYYFLMIKRILESNNLIKHAVIANFSQRENEIIDEIFGEDESKSRLIICPTTSEYGLLFQSCDVFVDSFPISSALTQLDLMKFKVPTVVKINTENALWSFHEYMPKDYPYMFENVDDMQSGILNLLYDKDAQKKAIDMNYNHYLENYEGNVVKQKYINLIENCDRIEQFYEKLDDEASIRK